MSTDTPQIETLRGELVPRNAMVNMGECADVPCDPPAPGAITMQHKEFWGTGQIEDNGGVRADHINGLTHSAAWRGVNFIADMVAKVPAYVFVNLPEGGAAIDRTHFAHRPVRREANRLMSAAVWRHVAVFHAVWWGNHVSYIERNQDGEAVAYWPLRPGCWGIHNHRGEVTYHVVLNGQHFTFDQSNAFHIFGLSHDGIIGVDFITYARAALGHGLTVRKFGTKFFGTGANASGILHLPPGLDETQIAEFVKGFTKSHASLDGAHKTMVLYDGAKYEKLTIPPESAQFLQTQNLSDKHIANFLKIPASIVGVESSVAYASLEQHRQEVLDSGIDPWLCRFEDEHWRKTLTERQKETESHKVKFRRSALKRVSFKDMVDGETKLVDSGIKNLDESRAEFDHGAIPDGHGARHRMPRNFMFIDSPDAQGQANNGPAPQAKAATQAVLSDALRRGHFIAMRSLLKQGSTATAIAAIASGDMTFDLLKVAEVLRPAVELAGAALRQHVDKLDVVARWSRNAQTKIESWLDLPFDEVRGKMKNELTEYDADAEALAILEGKPS